MLHRLVVVVIACGAGCASTSTAARPTGPVGDGSQEAGRKAQAVATWSCFAYEHGEVGGCFRSPGECQAMVSSLRGDSTTGEPILDCTTRRDVVCFNSQNRNGTVEPVCHPTFAVCRSHVDHDRAKADDDMRVVSECAREHGSSPSTGAATGVDPDEAAHWWCVSLLHGQVGSCKRSRTRCEQVRDWGLRNRQDPSDDVSDCTSQRSAMCSEFVAEDGTHLLQCHPTMDTCRVHYEQEKRQSRAPDRIIDCHPLE